MKFGPRKTCGPGGDVHGAVAVEIGRDRAPRVVEIAQLLLAEPVRDLLDRTLLDREILVADLLEPHLAGAADEQREGAETSRLVVRHAARGRTAVIDERAYEIGVEQDLDRVPLPRTQARVRRTSRQSRAGCLVASPSASATASATRSAGTRASATRWRGVRRRRRSDPDASPAGPQPLPGELSALRVEGDAVRRDVAGVERHQDPLQAVSGLLGPQQDAGLASRRALERGVEADVLIRPVQQEPAAGRLFRRADDLAVLRAPGRLAERAPTGQARPLEDGVRAERRAGSRKGNERGQTCRRHNQDLPVSVRHSGVG